MPPRTVGSRRTATRVTAGAICLSSSGHAVLEMREPGGVAARSGQIRDEADANWVRDQSEHNWYRPGCLLEWPGVRVAGCHDDIRRESDQFRGVSTLEFHISSGPTRIEPDIASKDPPQLL